MIESDACHDPQAWVLRPDVVLEISSEIMKHERPLVATLAAIEKGLAVMRQASVDGRLDLAPVEQRWLDLLSTQLETVPRDEEQLLAQVRSRYDENVFIWEEYVPYS